MLPQPLRLLSGGGGGSPSLENGNGSSGSGGGGDGLRLCPRCMHERADLSLYKTKLDEVCTALAQREARWLRHVQRYDAALAEVEDAEQLKMVLSSQMLQLVQDADERVEDTLREFAQQAQDVMSAPSTPPLPAPPAAAAPRQQRAGAQSLLHFIDLWDKAQTWEEQEAGMTEVMQHWHQDDRLNLVTADPLVERANRNPAAVAGGDMRKLRECVIQRWKDVNRPYQGVFGGDTLLHVVCREGYDGMAVFMLDPATKSAFEQVTLDVNATNKKGRTPLMLCFTPPSLTLVAKANGLEQDPEIGCGRPKAKRPEELTVAADWLPPGDREARERLVERLLAAGARVNALDLHDYTCLHYAAMLGWVGSVEALLKAGADPGHKSVTGETALHLAIERRHGAAAESLLLASPSLVDESDRDGTRAIHTAIRCRCGREFLELLADHKADMNAPDYSGVTPLQLACSLQDHAAVSALLDLKVVRESPALALLKGDDGDRIRARIAQEDAERARLAQDALSAQASDAQAREDAARARLARDALSAQASEAQARAHRAYGQWVPYIDKQGRGIFYYNKVSRETRWEQPPDYVQDKAYVMKSATHGMSFYH
ncbi:ankyrin repeat-containing domain protein [Tribonema minus]|uniref:Ankyrin repeat-containing domain protein n=1 Tax=Tribonema minus TaxID=303371 RepID=A0A835Z5D7_9STRA|nr:ankyrin repeat-containing domain protein [Tribonema minus]